MAVEPEVPMPVEVLIMWHPVVSVTRVGAHESEELNVNALAPLYCRLRVSDELLVDDELVAKCLKHEVDGVTSELAHFVKADEVGPPMFEYSAEGYRPQVERAVTEAIAVWRAAHP